MTTIVTRLFDSPDQAASAVRELGHHFAARAIIVTQPGAANALAALQDAGMSKFSAAPYAERIAAGAAAVTVLAPFGHAVTAQQVLARFGGVALAAEDDHRPAVSVAAPLSAMLGWPVLCDNPAPLSSSLGMQAISRGRPPKARLMNNPAPLSRMFMLPALSRRQSPGNSSFGMPLLSRNPAPLSSAVGMKVLSDNPTPLSSALGMTMLFEDPTPLSTTFAFPVLTDEDNGDRRNP